MSRTTGRAAHARSIIYLAAATALHRGTLPALRAARVALSAEFAGVLIVGALTVASPDLLGTDPV